MKMMMMIVVVVIVIVACLILVVVMLVVFVIVGATFSLIVVGFAIDDIQKMRKHFLFQYVLLSHMWCYVNCPGFTPSVIDEFRACCAGDLIVIIIP